MQQWASYELGFDKPSMKHVPTPFILDEQFMQTVILRVAAVANFESVGSDYFVTWAQFLNETRDNHVQFRLFDSTPIWPDRDPATAKKARKTRITSFGSHSQIHFTRNFLRDIQFGATWRRSNCPVSNECYRFPLNRLNFSRKILMAIVRWAAGGSSHFSFLQMLNDFDLLPSEFDVMSSPVVCPTPQIDLPLSFDSREFEFSGVGFNLEENDAMCCSQPLDVMDDIPAPRFEIHVGNNDRIKTLEKKKKASFPTVFKPFASFESLELTVRNLRQRVVNRPQSTPIGMV